MMSLYFILSNLLLIHLVPVGSLKAISVFAIDVLQIDFLLWSLVGNISNKSINKIT